MKKNKIDTTGVSYEKQTMKRYYYELLKAIGEKYSSERNEKMKDEIIKTAVETTTSNDNLISLSN